MNAGSMLQSLNEMTPVAYSVLLLKFIGIIGGMLTGLFGLFVSAYKAFVIFWGVAVRHMSQSLSKDYIPRSEFDSFSHEILEATRNLRQMTEVSLHRLADGDSRMEKLDHRITSHDEVLRRAT